MAKIAFLLGLRELPNCEPCFEQARAEKRAELEALLADIAAR